jgi:hypothetical protein
MVRRSATVLVAIAAVFALFPASAFAQQFGWVAAPTAADILGHPSIMGDQNSYVTLADGRVLATGAGGNTATAILDASGKWTRTGDMVKGRTSATAIRLNDGRVLAIGGYIYYGSALGGQLADAELYDPATGQWSLVEGTMSQPRGFARAVVMKDGRVLVAGGMGLTGDGGWYPWGYQGTAAVDIFDPATNSWQPAAPMSMWHDAYSRSAFQLRLLGDGRVIAWDNAWWPSVHPEVYNPVTNSWDWFGGADSYSIATALSDGRLMMVPPIWNYASTETPTRIFDPVTNAWSNGPPIPQFRNGDRFIAMPDGTVMFAGGFSVYESWYEYEGTMYQYWAQQYGDTWVFNPSQNAWSPGPAWKLTSGQPLPPLQENDFVVALPMAEGRMFLTSGAMYRQLKPPVAVGTNLTLNGTTGVPGLYNVDASGSYDPDGDALTDYVWKEGNTVLSSGPSASQQILLGVGTHQLTLTVTDATFLTNTTAVTVVVQDSAAAAWIAVEACSASLAAAQGAIAPLNAALAAANATISTLQAELAEVQQVMRTALGDPSFVVPGATVGEQLDNVTSAISKLNPGQKKALADALTGKKK